MNNQNKISEALKIIWNHGGTDGEHHKQWVLDQVVRCLTENEYNQWVESYEKPLINFNGEAEQYKWDKGIAP